MYSKYITIYNSTLSIVCISKETTHLNCLVLTLFRAYEEPTILKGFRPLDLPPHVPRFVDQTFMNII